MTTGEAETIAEAKRTLRKRARARRSEAREAAGPGAADAAARNFFDAITPPAGCVVSGYWPMNDEFDVRPLLAALYARGHGCGLPVVAGKGRPLVFRAWTPETALVPAAFGISVPPEDAPEVTPALLLVPLLAFDDRGYRLGYGGGFYDLTLARLRAGRGAVLAVGVAFDGQRVDAVPAGASDQPLDWVVTEARALEVA
ncbi:MAG: 5-formyltetrahydrofolate cyclo-ligase [Alphaproteobacteria bacterium]